MGLTAHVIASVGWMGAVVVYLVLAWTGIRSTNSEVVRGAYLMMEVTIWGAILPLSLASLVTGIVQSFITAWGLIRHYWVIFKLALNLIATAILFLYAQSIGYYADLATSPDASAQGDLSNPTHVVHSLGALTLLVVASVLGVYKPRGVTRYGRLSQNRERSPA